VTPKLKFNGTARYAFDVGEYKSFAQATVFHQSSTTYSLEATRFYAGDTPSFTTFDFSAGTGLNNWHLEAYIENAFDKLGQLGRNSECNDGVHYCLTHAHIYPIKPMQFGVKFGRSSSPCIRRVSPRSLTCVASPIASWIGASIAGIGAMPSPSTD